MDDSIHTSMNQSLEGALCLRDVGNSGGMVIDLISQRLVKGTSQLETMVF